MVFFEIYWSFPLQKWPLAHCFSCPYNVISIPQNENLCCNSWFQTLCVLFLCPNHLCMKKVRWGLYSWVWEYFSTAIRSSLYCDVSMPQDVYIILFVVLLYSFGIYFSCDCISAQHCPNNFPLFIYFLSGLFRPFCRNVCKLNCRQQGEKKEVIALSLFLWKCMCGVCVWKCTHRHTHNTSMYGFYMCIIMPCLRVTYCFFVVVVVQSACVQKMTWCDLLLVHNLPSSWHER